MNEAGAELSGAMVRADNDWHSRLFRLFLGPDPERQMNLKITLSGQLGYLANLGLVWYCVHNGLMNPALGWPISLALIATLIGFYLALQARRQGGELPEDSLMAVIDDGAPEIGEFSPWSWWPLVLASAAAFFVVGLAIGTWLSFIGGAILVIALFGWTYEYYRGYFAR